MARAEAHQARSLELNPDDTCAWQETQELNLCLLPHRGAGIKHWGPGTVT